VGEEYIYIFGLKANEVAEKLRENGTGDVSDIINSDYSLRQVLNQLTDGTLSPENPVLFHDLYNTLVNGDYGYPDVYMVIRDFEAYSKIHEQINKDYSDKKLWTEKAIMNTASAGFFSSDRTIQNYNDAIWHLKSI
ncbi:MAG: glycogen/starch/alpha-glucan phosphorylase, partial [Oscillospiraceae bacterium]|nr:glycogen/starch/alpha-glucan phosphorylase [Oscillospiraceae bacterium]